LAIGIDVGGTNLKFGLVNKNGKILKEIILPTLGHLGKGMVLKRVIEGIKEISCGTKKTRLLGLGLGTPGLVDTVKGVVRGHTNIPGWTNIPLKKILEKEIGLPAFVDNDVNVMTLAEWACGGAKGAQNVVCLTLGTGVGGGIIIEGKLYHGTSLSAGEIGHIPINFKGPKCMCGNIGCLERYIGNRYIADMAKKYFKKEKRSMLTPELLAKRAKHGDRLALKVWDEVAECLAAALSGIVNFVNPEKIIIGGGVSNAGNVLFTPLRKKLREKAMPIPAKDVKILKAALGARAGIIGAAMLVFL
ncbi:MAG: ROK family protein, partial [Candidatus Omnitrophica bacterium]|nr:ROK family protein [Candidatus Omnitrophota bacterium]